MPCIKTVVTVKTSGQSIAYIYDATGNMIRKIANSGTATTTTDYIDGFVYVNSTLSYFPMPEGRMVNEGGHLKPQYVVTDQQGNARITFDNTGPNNTAKVLQENSYYGFGMVMPGSAVTTLPTPPNKNLYNGGSEIQDDFSNLPDLMQTFYRNYDAALGRWTGVDPQADAVSSLTTYQYSGNNPIMGNDPLGNKVVDPGYNNLYNNNLGTAYQLGMQGANWVSSEDQADADWYQWLGGAGGGGGNGDYSAFWSQVFGNAMGLNFDYNYSKPVVYDPHLANALANGGLHDINSDDNGGFTYLSTQFSVTINPNFLPGLGVNADNPYYEETVKSVSYTVNLGDQGGPPLTHAQELAKYGYIISGSNITGTLSLGIGGTIEFGFVTTSKHYTQHYMTIYYTHTAAAGVGENVFTVKGKSKSKNTTFSDWAGPVFGGTVNYGDYSGTFGTSSNSYSGGGGVGVGLSLKLFVAGSVGYTYLIGPPVLNDWKPEPGDFAL